MNEAIIYSTEQDTDYENCSKDLFEMDAEDNLIETSSICMIDNYNSMTAYK